MTSRRLLVVVSACASVLVASVLALPAGAVPPEPAAKPYVAADRVHDLSAEAFFTELDATGRYRTFVQVFAADSLLATGRPAQTSRPLSIDVRVRDERSGDLVLDATAFADLDDPAISADQQLEEGRVTGRLVGVDGVSGREVTLAADLLLLGTGALERVHDRVILHEDGFTLNATGRVEFRPAVATGQVTVDGRSMVSGPSIAAPITRLTSGSVSIVAQ